MTDEQTIRIEALKIATSLTSLAAPQILHKQAPGETWADCRDLAVLVEMHIKNETFGQTDQ
jgi:hypothetical protein